MEHGAEEPPAPRVTGDEQLVTGQALASEIVDHGHDVVDGRRKWELGSKPVVRQRIPHTPSTRARCAMKTEYIRGDVPM